MAGGLNKAMLIGHLGRDPEVRYTQAGMAVANFTLATSEVFNNKDGVRETRTEWHRIVAFGRLGEICGQYLAKGKQIYIEGRIQTREWDDKDGNKRHTTEIVASQMQMLGSKGQSADMGRPQNSGGRPAASPSAAPDYPMGPEGMEDDIPF